MIIVIIRRTVTVVGIVLLLAYISTLGLRAANRTSTISIVIDLSDDQPPPHPRLSSAKRLLLDMRVSRNVWQFSASRGSIVTHAPSGESSLSANVLLSETREGSLARPTHTVFSSYDGWSRSTQKGFHIASLSLYFVLHLIGAGLLSLAAGLICCHVRSRLSIARISRDKIAPNHVKGGGNAVGRAQSQSSLMTQKEHDVTDGGS